MNKIQINALIEENKILRKRIAELEAQIESYENIIAPSNDIIEEVFMFWCSLEICKPRSLSNNIKQNIVKALDRYSKEEVMEAINGYAEAYYDEYYDFNTKYTLNEFLTKSNGLKAFMEDGKEWLRYISFIAKNKHLYK